MDIPLFFNKMDSKQIVIVGCGFGGIAAAVKLKKDGFNNFTIFEKGSKVGGTWYYNTYPDCGCDVPSMLYSYSFEQYPEWDRMWAKQHQILTYLEFVVEKYGLEKHIKLSSTVRCCEWDQTSTNWKISVEKDGSQSVVVADYVMMATGALHVPQFPSIEGLNPVDGSSVFKGDSYHAATWNHDVSLFGKRVGIIGSGASAIQIVPKIAKQVKELHIFQRTAPWLFYKCDFEFPNFVKAIFRYIPGAMTLIRYFIYICTEIRFLGLYQNSWMNKWMAWDSLRYLRNNIPDASLRAKVTPKEIIGCKRMLFSSLWYHALSLPHVAVITEALTGVTETGLAVRCTAGPENDQTETKNIDLDVIVYATGFQLVRGAASPPAYAFEVKGKNGKTLTQWMVAGPESYYGINAVDFPNMFFIYGPNTNLGHNSIVFMIECQVDYSIKLIKLANKKKWRYIEVTEDSVKKFQSQIIEPGMSQKVWNSCSSWYRWPVKSAVDGSISYTGEVYTMWPHSTVWYYWKTLWPVASAYVQFK